MPLARPDVHRAERELVLLPFAPTVRAQLILNVEFRSPNGRSWRAVGGGDTLEDAIAWARESCPPATGWELVGWDRLYGD
jgi:hypothetical protein